MINKLVIIILLLGCFVIAVNAGEIIVSSGTSVDLKVHRSPYASALKIGQENINVAGAAIIWGNTFDNYDIHSDKRTMHKFSDYALVLYSDRTWSTGATNRVDSFGHGNYYLPRGKSPRDIVGVGFSGGGVQTLQKGFVFIWFSDGTACTCLFPHSYFKNYYILKNSGNLNCGDPNYSGKHYGYTLASGKRHKGVVGVGIARNNLVFAYYRDGTVSAGTSDDLDSKRPATKYQLPTGMTPEDIIDIGIAYNNHVYAFYRTKAKTAPKRFKDFKLKTPK